MTSDRQPCERFCDALLDPAAPRPPDLEAHLATCPTCRSLRDAHRAAERLAPAPGDGGHRRGAVRMDEVLARVTRRRRARVAGVAAAAAVALALGLRLTAPSKEPAFAGGDLFALADSVRGYATRDVGAEDPAVLAYPALAAWLAPPALRSLELPSLSPSPSPAFGAAAGGSP